jgi:hypothetical protein
MSIKINVSRNWILPFPNLDKAAKRGEISQTAFFDPGFLEG